jgi:diacylglycerol kinase (ATP)
MNSSKLHIVVNPTAGSGKAKKIAFEVEQKVKSAFGSEVAMTFTKEKNHATTITRQAIIKGTELIIAAGGDGTINEVTNGFFNEGISINPDCELGIINCGTGRGFANSINLPETIEKQIEVISQACSTHIDLGQITCKGFSGKTTHRLFINECQAGIGSKVASVVVGKKQKKLGGPLAFGLTATIQAIKFKPIWLNIEFDNEPVQEFKLIGLVIGNGTECAGGMKLTPGAKANDGLFDVLLMHDMNPLQRVLNLSKTYAGTHILSPYFSIKRCKKLRVTCDGDSLIEADGEMLGYTPFTVEMIPAAIKVKTNIKIPM